MLSKPTLSKGSWGIIITEFNSGLYNPLLEIKRKPLGNKFKNKHRLSQL